MENVLLKHNGDRADITASFDEAQNGYRSILLLLFFGRPIIAGSILRQITRGGGRHCRDTMDERRKKSLGFKRENGRNGLPHYGTVHNGRCLGEEREREREENAFVVVYV